MTITGKGSLILDCLNTMAVQGIIYYGANKPTKSGFYQQSHVEYKNGVLTPGGLDLDIDGDLFVRNGKLNTGLFDDPDEAPFDYREAPFSYKDGVLTFRDNTVISEITFTAIGDVKYVFDGAAELSSDYSTVFNQVYGSASFEAADGADVKIKSDQDSAIRAYSAVSFNGGGRITVEAPVYYNAVHADAVICGGELTDVSGKSKAVYDGSAEKRITTYTPLSSIVIHFNGGSTSVVPVQTSVSLDGTSYDADTQTLTLSSDKLQDVDIVGDISVILDGATLRRLTCDGKLALTLKNDSNAQNIIADTLTVNAENGTLSLSYKENALLLGGDLIVGGEVFTSCNGTKCYISNKSAVFGNDTSCIYLDGAYFSPSENGSYYACDENVGWLNTKNTDTAPLYARKIRKTIGNTTATSIRLTMKNADIAGKNDESVIFCDGDLDIVLVGENKLTPVSAMPTPSLAPTSMRANENTAADGDELSTYGMPICVQGSLTISGTLMLSACSGGRECTLIAAGYSGGRLDGVKSLPLSAQSLNVSVAVSELCPELAGSKKIKAMLWNGFMPITPNAEN